MNFSTKRGRLVGGAIGAVGILTGAWMLIQTTRTPAQLACFPNGLGLFVGCWNRYGLQGPMCSGDAAFCIAQVWNIGTCGDNYRLESVVPVYEPVADWHALIGTPADLMTIQAFRGGLILPTFPTGEGRAVPYPTPRWYEANVDQHWTVHFQATNLRLNQKFESSYPGFVHIEDCGEYISAKEYALSR